MTNKKQADCDHALLHGCEFPTCQNCGAVWFDLRAYNEEMTMRAHGQWGKAGAGHRPNVIGRAVENFRGKPF